MPGVYPDPFIIFILPLSAFLSFPLFITGCYARYVHVNFWPFSQRSFTFTVPPLFHCYSTRFMPGFQVQPQVDAWECFLILLFTFH